MIVLSLPNDALDELLERNLKGADFMKALEEALAKHGVLDPMFNPEIQKQMNQISLIL